MLDHIPGTLVSVIIIRNRKNMGINLLLHGLILGISIAAPVGPIGVLCIRRTIADGHLIGLVSGFGAATADALYGVIAGFGLTLITTCLCNSKRGYASSADYFSAIWA